MSSNGRRPLRALALTLAATLALAACGSTPDTGTPGSTGQVDGKKYTLKLATPTPAAHHWSKNALNTWKSMVAEKTGNRVEVQLYEGGSLGSFGSVLTDLQGGVYDVGMIVPSYFLNSEVFAYSALSLPFAYPDPATGGKIGTEFMKSVGDQASVKGIRNMGVATSDTFVLFSTEKVATLDDLKGKKIRAQSAVDGAVVTSWGATPVDIPVQESYEALEKSVIDVSPYSPVGSMGFKTYEVAPHVLLTNAWGTVTIPAMSDKFYSGLPDDLKKAFDNELSPALAQLMQDSYVKEDKVAREKLVGLTKENGGEVLELDPAELARFQAVSSDQWTNWVTEAGKRGQDGKALMDAYLAAMKAAGATPPAGVN